MARGTIDYERKAQLVKDKRDNRPNEYRQLRYAKLIGEVVKRIVRNDNKILKKNDLSEICVKVYGTTNKIKEIRVRKMLETSIAKTDINNELQRIYTDAGLDKSEIKLLLSKAKEWILEKKDITNALKLAEKIEKANNLDQKQGITARTTETIDYSKIGKDGLPASKVTKTLEISNIAPTDQVTQDEYNSANI